VTIAIKIENLSKQYRLGLVSTRTLSHDLNRWYQTTIRGKEDPYLKIGGIESKRRSDGMTDEVPMTREAQMTPKANDERGVNDYIWALRDINLEVEQGEVLGIIGKNGAGKSTLLKILSKVTAPTTGTIKAKGRIASLLEVGTGFHPEMTGRENIFMNGSIMGMRKAEITRKLDEIVDFAGVETFIDTPVKRYSSGMTVRLGFAVAAHLEPEILVVDEILAVGDAEFQQKAIGKMQDLSQGDGRTVLFVSHNLATVENLCSRSILLENGNLYAEGLTSDVISEYLNNRIQDAQIHISARKDRAGNGTFRITDMSVSNGKGEETIRSFDQLVISVSLNTKLAKNTIARIVLGVYERNGNPLFRIDSQNIHVKEQGSFNGITVSTSEINLVSTYCHINVALYINDSLSDYLANAVFFEIVEREQDGFTLHNRNMATILVQSKVALC